MPADHEAWARALSLPAAELDNPQGAKDLLVAIATGWTESRRWVFIPCFMDLGPFDLDAARAWSRMKPLNFSDVDGTVINLADLGSPLGFRDLRECYHAWRDLRRSGVIELEEQHLPWLAGQDGAGQLGRLYSIEPGSKCATQVGVI